MFKVVMFLGGHGQANFDGIFFVEVEGEHEQILHRRSIGEAAPLSRGLASLLSKNFTSEGAFVVLRLAS